MNNTIKALTTQSFFVFLLKRKMLHFLRSEAFNILGGGRGIRTPGPVTVNGFQDRRIRPLCHSSGANVKILFR